VALFALLFALLACRGAGEASASRDPLAAEIERWSALLHSETATPGIRAEARQANQVTLARADKDLRDGRRLLALQRFAGVRESLAAAAYLSERPAGQRKDMAGFEAEWARMGGVLRENLGAPSASALEGVEPAAVRALGEAALPQVRAYYEASLEYGRNTMPDQGLYYLGAAQAQKELAAFCRTLSAPTPRRAPPVRPLHAELDALEAEMLAAYRPPASIDQHRQFIVASSTLKEARELDAAGLRYGALLRYLQAVQQLAPLRRAPAAPDAGALARRLRELEARLSAGGVDHSVGQLFLEIAQSEAGSSPEVAAAIVDDVLPRYFAALGPAPPAAPRPAPRVTVTLVRWPYT
jgi:hypothetical protein